MGVRVDGLIVQIRQAENGFPDGVGRGPILHLLYTL